MFATKGPRGGTLSCQAPACSGSPAASGGRAHPGNLPACLPACLPARPLPALQEAPPPCREAQLISACIELLLVVTLPVGSHKHAAAEMGKERALLEARPELGARLASLFTGKPAGSCV